MDFVHTGPSGLDISSLEVAMQDLASLDVAEIGGGDLSAMVVEKFLSIRSNRLSMFCSIGLGDLLMRPTVSRGPDSMEEQLRRLQLTCKEIKDMLEKWEAGWLIRGSMEIMLDALEQYCYDIQDLVDDLRLGGVSPWRTVNKISKLQRCLEGLCCGIERVRAAQNSSNEVHHSNESLVPPYKSLSFDGTLIVRRKVDKQTVFVGRDKDTNSITDMLLSDDPHHLGVSIIGMDGLGKTSLAQTILYNHRIEDGFDLILSAVVASHFQVEDVVRKLVADRSKKDDARQSSRVLEDLLENCRGALIVLDDVWCVTYEEWDKFKHFLNSCRSCKIVTTTRNPKVAEVTGSIAYYLNRMTDEDCYNLIMQKAEIDLVSDEIWASDDVKSISKKCHGMPILASKLGLCLSGRRSLDERFDSIARFKNEDLWDLPEIREVFPYLKLNEPKLSPHLKKCIAYFSLFSPNHKFRKDDLIQLWEAEGFVRPQHKIGGQPTGSHCFDDLLSRSILQPLESSYTEMHPLYVIDEIHHKFATLLASKTFLRIDEDTATNFPFSFKNIRHMSSCSGGIDPLLSKKIKECKGLRTFFYSETHITSSLTFSRKLESLRLLDLSHTSFSELPLSLSQLKHLRYLNLSESNIQSLPDPIYPLRALQILMLRNCSGLKLLPKDLNQLINLTRLHVDMKLLDRLPSNLGMLTDLESLTCYAVEDKQGNRIAELKNMKHLRELYISRLENIHTREQAEESMLKTKHRLKRLVLEWHHPVGSDKDVVEGLEPHNELKELLIRNYTSKWFPAWLISPYRKLVSFCLEGCYECKILPSLGQLPFLRNLVLRSVGDVENVDRMFCGERSCAFPCLESLEFRKMITLYKWDGLEEGDMPCLRSLRIIDCPKLLHLPNPLLHKGSLMNLEIDSCRKLTLEIPSEFKDGRRSLIIKDSPSVEQKSKVGKVDTSPFPVKVQEDEVPPTIPPGLGDGDHTLQEFGGGTITGGGKIVTSDDSYLQTHPGAFGEDRLVNLDSDIGKNVHSPTAGPILDMEQDFSKEMAPAISPTHHPDIDAIDFESPGAAEYKERFSVQTLEPAKILEGKRTLFLFEEGYEFEKMMLIQLWMAMGLLTDEHMERTGANYFEELVSQGYMLCSDVACSLYKVNTGKLNTELDMNIIDKQNYIILDNGSPNDAQSEETWHASVVCDELDASIFKRLRGFNRLRTLLFLGDYGSRVQRVPRELFLCYESLLTLDLSGTHIEELPSSVGKMVNLRYLDLSWTFIDVLPERMDRFEKLQTLKLEGCTRLRQLPQEMVGLIELRHLHLDVLRQISGFPKKMGALVNIRTLSAFPVGTEEGLKISELKYLNNLTGKFCIAKMENVQSIIEAKEASLTAKKNIAKLELKWSDHQYEQPRNDDEFILENLRPHSDLEEIQILCYPGSRIPDWIADVSFHKLVNITLFRCLHLALLPSLWNLPSLVSLGLISLNNLTNMDCKGEANLVAFPKLQKLEVYEMLHLQTWIEARKGDYPCLMEITIKDCPKLSELPSLPYLPSVTHLEVSGCKNLAFVSKEELSTSLQQLIVDDCPLIKMSCSKEGDQDWHKIQHIPAIWIDQVAIHETEDDNSVLTEDDH